MTIADFDHLDSDKKRELLYQCCGSLAWVNKILTEPAFEDLVDLLEEAEKKWFECNEEDWLEAFKGHPEIGNINSLKDKYAATEKLATEEQSGVKDASENILAELADINKLYREKFGFIFIVFATGKSSEQMLRLLKQRINNDAKEELKIAAEEQNKITELRLQKLFA